MGLSPVTCSCLAPVFRWRRNFFVGAGAEIFGLAPGFVNSLKNIEKIMNILGIFPQIYCMAEIVGARAGLKFFDELS
jgi:hypothetical protein